MVFPNNRMTNDNINQMHHSFGLPQVGPSTTSKLNKLGLNEPKDLLNHFPLRYVDFSHTTDIISAPLDQNITISGTITKFNQIFTRFGKNIQKATLTDATGSIDLVWFNQPFISKTFSVGSQHRFAGTVSLFQNKKTMIAPLHGEYNTAQIIAIYPETKGLTSNWFRKIINQNYQTLSQTVSESLPDQLIEKYHLLPLKTAYQNIHQPQTLALLEASRLRLALNEILSIQAFTFLSKQKWLSVQPQFILKADPKLTDFIKQLPFTLTGAQIRVWQEIEADLTSPHKVMNRLLQGDVGSGKTIIALLAALLAHLNHHQVLYIAPTQILAKQHFDTFKKGLKNQKVVVNLMTASKNLPLATIKKTHIIIATHAALFKNPDIYDKVGLVIIDEQHKFGVKQRSFFSQKLRSPHLLTMTATPIPRTISLTLLGNLDVSIIDELPKNRLIIQTFCVPPQKQNDCYHWIENQINTTKCQVFIVCPFIDSSESDTTVKAATVEFELLKKNIFPKLKLALIHGKTKHDERSKIIKLFANNKINILVTTPIIEVGIDFPNATIMIIQSADRFGLAQLHQLRGRVGRGVAQSYCYLFSENTSSPALQRLNYLEKHHLGIDIAQFDLQLRGPGEFFSHIQHGFPALKLANLSDSKLISLSQQIINDCQKIDTSILPKLITHSQASLGQQLN